MLEIMSGIIVFLLLIVIALIVIIIKKQNNMSFEDIKNKLNEYEKYLNKFEELLKTEFNLNRTEFNENSKSLREEISKIFTNFSGLIEQRLKNTQDLIANSFTENKKELSKSLKSFEENFSKSVKDFNELQKQKFDILTNRQEELTQKTEAKLEKVREVVEQKLKLIQDDNSAKLEKIRETVDEKLHKTLETRLGESFKIVSDKLESVQKGLGEMQALATGVGDLKKVLSNVKTKGVFGEYQLENILEQLLTPEQYSKNVKTNPQSNEIVEFAIKIPSKEDSDKIIWLPIDAKFPTKDYEMLMNAYESADVSLIEQYRKNIENRIKSFAKDIKVKYIDPPNTTDFAIMFLPFEGLYAEVLRIPGILQMIQRDYKVTITGPTTLSAFLNSLQMGFRSLAIEKRTSEIWEVLGTVKTEFKKFADVLDRTKKKLLSATDEIDKAGIRTRAIERKLRNVQELPVENTVKIIEDASVENSQD